MGLFGHWWEIVVIVGIALLVFGPGRFTNAGAGVRDAIRAFRESNKDESSEE